MSKEKIRAIVFAGIAIVCLAIAIIFGMPSPGIFHQWACNLIWTSIVLGIIAGIYAFIPKFIHGKWQYIIGFALVLFGAYGFISGSIFLRGFAMIVVGVFLLLTDLRL